MQAVVVHFPMGAIAAARDGAMTLQPSVDVPAGAIAGANGAGDAFAAGFLYAFHEGRAIGDALALAHAAAAASLRSVTTTGGVESRAECLALADRWGWREAMA
jgi:sugar/nucleoside kinase (ribokinase family)